jgi:hypothetical protein
MKRKPLSTRDDFEHWLAHMPFALDDFLDGLPEEIRRGLDYSVESAHGVT